MRKKISEMTRVKYPRTPHLPFSEGATSDDRMLKSDSIFNKKNVVITVKMDGENTTVYSDGAAHARSLDSKKKEYHSWLMNNIQSWSYLLPSNLRVCGEYLYAKHSIRYSDLSSYFLAFSVWKDDLCLSWKDTIEQLNQIGVLTVPILYEGVYDTKVVEKLARDVVKNEQEGLVVRIQDSFLYKDFDKNVAKYVRKNHVQTDKHWSLNKIEKNMLKTNVVSKCI